MNDRLLAFSIAMIAVEKLKRKKQILQFLRELRGSDDRMQKIFLEGSCFRLYCILKTIYPDAKPYYSQVDGHWITKIDGSYYDINGKLSKDYIKDKGYEHETETVTLASAYIHTASNQIGTSYRKYEEI